MGSAQPFVELSDAEVRNTVSTFLTPSGRELVVSLIKGNALYRIAYGDGAPGGIPDKYAGLYTKPEYAQEDLIKCLADMWSVVQVAAVEVVKRQRKVKEVVEA